MQIHISILKPNLTLKIHRFYLKEHIYLDNWNCLCYNKTNKIHESFVAIERRTCKMKYTKPVVLKPAKSKKAVCGGGTPCGRPCTKRA